MDNIKINGHFIQAAQRIAQLSSDPHTKVGACIVNGSDTIIATGYNAFPQGASDDSFTWEREGDTLDTKYPYIVHAELNAILQVANRDALKGARLYVTLFPCNECAKAIIQSGIREVFYLEDKYSGEDTTIAAKRLFDTCKVKYTQYITQDKD